MTTPSTAVAVGHPPTFTAPSRGLPAPLLRSVARTRVRALSAAAALFRLWLLAMRRCVCVCACVRRSGGCNVNTCKCRIRRHRYRVQDLRPRLSMRISREKRRWQRSPLPVWLTLPWSTIAIRLMWLCMCVCACACNHACIAVAHSRVLNFVLTSTCSFSWLALLLICTHPDGTGGVSAAGIHLATRAGDVRQEPAPLTRGPYVCVRVCVCVCV
jgi:hypothetical protein